jgi:hypothetical protein
MASGRLRLQLLGFFHDPLAVVSRFSFFNRVISSLSIVLKNPFPVDPSASIPACRIQRPKHVAFIPRLLDASKMVSPSI